MTSWCSRLGSQLPRPPIQGIDPPGHFTLWNVPDTDRTKRFLEEKEAKERRGGVGGGFIGALVSAENLRHAGLEVTLVDDEPGDGAL